MIFPIGRETITARFPWVTALLLAANTVLFFGTWPTEKAFLSARWPDAPLVTEAKALASLAMDEGSALPGDLRTRLEDLRAQPRFPDDEADGIFKTIDKTFDYLPPLKRPDWDLRYASYLKVRKEVTDQGVPWRSVLDRYVLRSDDPLRPRLFTHFWVHAGYLHFLVCMFFLWMAGAHMEESWGGVLTLLIYAAGGLAAATAVVYILPGAPWVLVGSSGAVAALMGGMLSRQAGSSVRFFYALGVAYGVFSLPAWSTLFLWLPAVYRMDWFTDGRLGGAAAHWFHGAGFLTGFFLGALAGLARGREGASGSGDSPRLLDHRAERAGRLLKEGRLQEAQDNYRAVLSVDHSHLPALLGLLATQDQLQQEEDAARTSVKVIRTSLELGRGQLAEETFRKWTMRLFQTRLPPQERLQLAQNLETMQLWREALAYYRSVLEQAKDTPFAGKALFSSGKVLKDQLKKPDDAAAMFRQLLDPPYDVEWRLLAEGELRLLGKL
jgi:membrane associated rhomboid family serine protease